MSSKMKGSPVDKFERKELEELDRKESQMIANPDEKVDYGCQHIRLCKRCFFVALLHLLRLIVTSLLRPLFAVSDIESYRKIATTSLCNIVTIQFIFVLTEQRKIEMLQQNALAILRCTENMLWTDYRAKEKQRCTLEQKSYMMLLRPNR